VQLGFVAGDHALDAAHVRVPPNRRRDFALVVGQPVVEPDAEAQAQAELLRQRRQFGELGGAVGAQARRQRRQQAQVGGQFLARRKALGERALPALEGVVGQPGDPRRRVRRRQRRIQGAPCGEIGQQHQRGDRQRTQPARGGGAPRDGPVGRPPLPPAGRASGAASAAPPSSAPVRSSGCGTPAIAAIADMTDGSPAMAMAAGVPGFRATVHRPAPPAGTAIAFTPTAAAVIDACP
jgi:hypothetical protein